MDITIGSLADILAVVISLIALFKANRAEKIVKQNIKGNNNVQAGRDLNV